MPLSYLKSLILLMIFNLCPRGIPICSIWPSYNSSMVSKSSMPLSIILSKYLSNFIAPKNCLTSTNSSFYPEMADCKLLAILPCFGRPGEALIPFWEFPIKFLVNYSYDCFEEPLGGLYLIDFCWSLVSVIKLVGGKFC